MSDRYSLHGLAIPEGLEELRLLLQEVSARHPAIDPMCVMLFETAVTEIANNVIEHGSPPGRVRWEFEIDVSRDRLQARLRDDGEPFQGTLETEMPDGMADGGRGLALARTILDELGYERQDRANVWTLTKLTGR